MKEVNLEDLHGKTQVSNYMSELLKKEKILIENIKKNQHKLYELKKRAEREIGVCGE